MIAQPLVNHRPKTPPQSGRLGGADIVSISPNPNTGSFVVSSNKNTLTYVKVMDLSGRLVYEQKTNSQQVELNNLNLSKGVYILHTKDSEQKEQISKLFISNE
jgi:hypothetical protein